MHLGAIAQDTQDGRFSGSGRPGQDAEACLGEFLQRSRLLRAGPFLFRVLCGLFEFEVHEGGPIRVHNEAFAGETAVDLFMGQRGDGLVSL